ncbi:KAP family P-loop NTPase fold protein [Colwellia sp. 12G3]|uniref:KAP family P-loop NTPase fold protein n=1 Tax=Colwellia sp. 12G3 TaxID=2058299 RepID=UPI000C33E488|nr:P-loop NTPase fold protein [Colwellia sp. 12G3]PKI18100.1 hypothetical protein CXF71_00580 [Colwellia sp. 12G3]
MIEQRNSNPESSISHPKESNLPPKSYQKPHKENSIKRPPEPKELVGSSPVGVNKVGGYGKTGGYNTAGGYNKVGYIPVGDENSSAEPKESVGTILGDPNNPTEPKESVGTSSGGPNQWGKINQWSGVQKIDLTSTPHTIKKNIKQEKSIIYLPSDFPGMRDSGSVTNGSRYSIAEYEYKAFRLNEIAEKISNLIPQHFVLYDYKGGILSNDQDVLNILEGIYGSDVEVDGDVLYINDTITAITPTGSESDLLTNELKDTPESIKAESIPFPKTINYKTSNPSLNVNIISETLSSIIQKIPDKSGMMIGIFGKWGRGKTYFVNKVWEHISKNSKFKRVNFSAWKYQDTKESWAYLYESMMAQYLSEKTYKGPDFWNKYIKLFRLNIQKNTCYPLILYSVILIASIVWNFGADKLAWIIAIIETFGLILLIKLFLFYVNQKSSAVGILNKYFSKKEFTDYLGLQSEIENEIEILLKTWIPTVSEDEKILLFVDDIDRCHIEKITGIIDGLRVILDNPEIHNRLLIITAIDDNLLRASLDYKYQTWETKNIDQMYTEYLEKIFVIGIKLDQIESTEISEVLENTIPPADSSKISKKIILDEITPVESISPEVEEGNKKINPQAEPQDRKANKGDSTSSKNENDFELSMAERAYLINSIKHLKQATPRKIKIFYYKYLILKKVIHALISDKGLLDSWNSSIDEFVIMDLLLHISNGGDIEQFNFEQKYASMVKTLKYSTKLVSGI